MNQIAQELRNNHFSRLRYSFNTIGILLLFLLPILTGCSGTQSESEGVTARYDIPYINDGLDKHRLDLFLPQQTDSFPLLVFIHGGGWHWGDRKARIDVYGDIGRSWAKAGIAVAVISYRLGDDHPIKEQISDAAAAVAWAYKNGPQYGADPNRFFIAGHSAGAHLTAMTIFDPQWLAKQNLSPDIFSGAVLWSGLYDVPDAIHKAGSFARNKIWYPIFGKEQKSWQDMSPATAYSRNHLPVPRILLVTAERDIKVIKQQSASLSAELKKNGSSVSELILEGKGHFSEVFSADEEDGQLLQRLKVFCKIK